MTYIENIYICLAAPMLIGAICCEKKYSRSFIFVAAGYTMCFLSAYINSFFAGFYHADIVTASVEIAPVVEEIIKLLPLLFYLIVMEPKNQDARMATITIGASFATFENSCYLIEHGAAEFSLLFIRGFGTGAMHIVCAVIVGYGLIYVWKRPWLKLAGTFGLLCAAITYHAIYNLFVSSEGIVQIIGYILPIITVAAGIICKKAAPQFLKIKDN